MKRARRQVGDAGTGYALPWRAGSREVRSLTPGRYEGNVRRQDCVTVSLALVPQKAPGARWTTIRGNRRGLVIESRPPAVGSWRRGAAGLTSGRGTPLHPQNGQAPSASSSGGRTVSARKGRH
jgi:hypothetical protein